MVMSQRKIKGVTLVEMMISVAILGIVFGIGPTIMRNMTRFSRMNTARLETQRSARESLSQINKALRQASAESIVISQESGEPPYSSLSFTTVDGRAIHFYQEGTDLEFSVDGATRTLTDNLRYISFAPPRTDDSNIISVSVTFEKSTYEGGTKALQMAIEKVRVMND